MSIRSLVEFNHDLTHELDDPAFIRLLQRYLTSGDSRWADELKHWGVRVIAQRHHSSLYHVPSETDGFSAKDTQHG